jgi:hypothetical protein
LDDFFNFRFAPFACPLILCAIFAIAMVSPVGQLYKRDKQAVRAAEAIQSCFRGHRVRTLKEDVLDTFAELCTRLAQETGVEAGFAWGDRIIPRAWRAEAAVAPATAAPTAAATNVAPEVAEEPAEERAGLLCYSDGEDEESLPHATAQLHAGGEAEEPLAMERLHFEPAALDTPAALDAVVASPRRCSPDAAAGNDNWQPVSAAKPAMSPCGKRASVAARSLYVSMSGSLESLLHADTQRDLAAEGETASSTPNRSAEQMRLQQQQQQQQHQDSSASSALQSREELLAELVWVKAELASRILHLKRDHSAAAAAAASAV